MSVVRSSTPVRPPDPVSPTSEPSTTHEPWGWNRHQRIGLAVLVLLLLVCLAIQYLRGPYRLDDPVVIVHGQQVTLPQRIDPNSATLEDLSRIPHIGEATAGKIIAYREARKATAVDGVVFRQPADLDNVPGVGPKLIEQLRPFLRFPDESPDTQPAP